MVNYKQINNQTMNKLKKLIAGAAIIAAPFSFALPALAEVDLNEQLDLVNDSADLPSNDLPTTLGTLISVFLGLLGIVFLLLTLYAGWLWMTSQGDEKATGKARSILTTAVVGLVILLSAYAISNFVITQLNSAIIN